MDKLSDIYFELPCRHTAVADNRRWTGSAQALAVRHMR
jgi:hypothetical protein